jgi:hypothetical protein
MSEDHDSTPISELDESASLNANDEFIISTKDSNDVYSSKKVKLSTVQNASGITVKEEGTALTTNATSLNFVGSTVTASGTGAEKTITITESAGGGGGTNITYINPHVLLDVGPSLAQADTGIVAAVNAWGTGKGAWQTFSIPSSVPSTATGILIRGETVSNDDNDIQCNTKIYMRTSSLSERVLSQSYSPNNSDCSSADVNSILVPYSSTIDFIYYGKGVSTHNMAKVYVDGYLESTGGGGGSGMKYSGAESTVPITTSWADLNLSSHVGSNRAYVMMKVWGGQPATQFAIKPKDEVLDPCYPGDAGARGTIGIYLLGDGSGCGAIVSVITDENGFVSVQGNVTTTTDVSWKILCYQVLS